MNRTLERADAANRELYYRSGPSITLAVEVKSLR